LLVRPKPHTHTHNTMCHRVCLTLMNAIGEDNARKHRTVQAGRATALERAHYVQGGRVWPTTNLRDGITAFDRVFYDVEAVTQRYQAATSRTCLKTPFFTSAQLWNGPQTVAANSCPASPSPRRPKRGNASGVRAVTGESPSGDEPPTPEGDWAPAPVIAGGQIRGERPAWGEQRLGQRRAA
jgi:hypothetical protein